MMNADLVVVGGGSAGLCAAIAARKKGVENIVVFERGKTLGGILRQCIHNGFGVHRYKEDLTGVEFAKRVTDEALELGINCLTETFALDIGGDLTVTAMSAQNGLFKIRAKSIILAMGCRERSRGALMIPGSRCAGVFTAGTAQRYLNLHGYLPGKKVVILGSGDIGLIMARQFVIEGAKVERVVEIMPYSGGLARNISQCLNDFDIPLSFNCTVCSINGKGRVSSVTVADVDDKRRPIPGTERDIPCDTLLISAGLLPENELTRAAGIEISPATKGAVVNDKLMTSLPGVFSCGNVLHVHDLVDNVAAEGTRAGENAADYLQNAAAFTESTRTIAVKDGEGVSGVVPQRLRVGEGASETVNFMFRPRNTYRDCSISVKVDGTEVRRIKQMVLTPGEMKSVNIDSSLLAAASDSVTISVEA